MLGLFLIVAGYALAHWVVGLAAANVADLARFNVGQYRHAVDVTFASAAVAAVLASVLAPPQPQARARQFRLAAWSWGAAILIDIAFGALFMARDAAAVWISWPGIGEMPLGRFVSYQPLWLNFVFNPYTIQLVHRRLSGVLWIAALGYLIWSIRRRPQSIAPAAGPLCPPWGGRSALRLSPWGCRRRYGWCIGSSPLFWSRWPSRCRCRGLCLGAGDRLPHRKRRRRHLDVAHAVILQRIEDGADHDRERRGGAAFAARLDAERIGGREHLDDFGRERRQHAGAGHAVVHQRAAQRLARPR